MNTPTNRARSLARRRTLDEFGCHETVAHAWALACRAWQPYVHYDDGDRGSWLRQDMPLHSPLSELPVENAVVRLFERRVPVDHEHIPPLALSIGERISQLPQRPFDPGSMHAHPAVVERATAITICMPAVVLALLDGRVPGDLATGTPSAARGALVDLHERYHADNPAFEETEHRLVRRTLLDAVADGGPIELRDDWRWMVFVTQPNGAPGPGWRLGAQEGHPLRCFDDLDEARRYAILQTDWSREIAGLPRDDDFLLAISRLATREPDGSEIGWRASSYLTVIAPRRIAPLPPTVPTRKGGK